jgi:hypothetical protein
MCHSAVVGLFLCAVFSFTQFAAARADYHGVDLYTVGKPDGFSSAVATAEPRDGGQMGGYGTGTFASGRPHAVLWSPDHPNGIDLNRSNFLASEINGTGGTQQFGGADNPSQNHAVVWSGTPESAIDIHPSGFTSSHLHFGTGGEQVGEAAGADTRFHATVWHGTAASAVDLHPASMFSTDLLLTDAHQQVGIGLPTQNGSIQHAVMWSGTPESFVICIHPHW